VQNPKILHKAKFSIMLNHRYSKVSSAPTQCTRGTFAAAMFAAVVVFSAGMDEAAAQTTLTWTGGGNGLWSDNTDWSPSVAPQTTGNYRLVFGGTTQTTNTNNIGTISVAEMSFTNNGSAGQTAVFTLSGSTLLLSNSLISTTSASGLATSGDVINNRLELTGSNTLSLGSGHSLTIGGDISGLAASLTKTGGGALYFTGSNSQTGTTYITGGNVRTGSGGVSSDSNNYAFGTGDVVVSGSGTLGVRNSSIVANNLTIGGAGSSAATGSLAGSFGASNQTAVVSGSVTLATDSVISTWGSTGVTGSKLSLTGPINIGANKLTLTQVANGAVTTSIEGSGVIAGTGSLVVDGTSNVSLNGASSYSGGTTLQSGTIRTGNSSALGSGSLAMNAGVLDLNGQSLSIGALSGSSGSLITSLVGGSASISSDYATGTQATYAGNISNGLGIVSLTKTGGGQLYLTGSNSQTGTTYITGGNVRTGSGGVSSDSNNYALGTGDVVVSGSGTLGVRNSSIVANNLTIGGVGSSAAAGSLAGSFGASNQTAVVSGSVTLATDSVISTWGSTGVTGSKLSLTGPINIGANKLTFSQVANGAVTTSIESSGVIAGTGSVVVDGGAAVYLNGANTYSGTTTVQSGVLGGNGTIAGAVTVQSGAFLTPGSAANTTGALSVGSLQLDSGATAAMAISGTGAGLYDQVVALGNVSYGGDLVIDFTTAGFANFDVWQLFSGSSFSNNFSSVRATGSYGELTFNDLGTGEWQATGGSLGEGQSLSFYLDNSQAIGSRYQAGQLVLVPEPSTIVFAGIGLAVMGWRRWSKRRSLESVASV
jgi:fibronectin-binding autotransporter adhesin